MRQLFRGGDDPVARQRFPSSGRSAALVLQERNAAYHPWLSRMHLSPPTSYRQINYRCPPHGPRPKEGGVQDMYRDITIRHLLPAGLPFALCAQGSGAIFSPGALSGTKDPKNLSGNRCRNEKIRRLERPSEGR